ncbi:transketolase [Irregularibacter muris]|uniref:Transketolase n=1 Tax=Irregularibacter muris TaxID=1796619 RepID=A0AAE3HF33_9FIRM|nr:transketolase [Irregularibacter muris]MCR1899397.1 transketolase [Irregularibacter muris]
MNESILKELKIKAARIRRGAIMGVSSAGSGHPGGSLSIADILAVLYFHEMKTDIHNPKDESRDRLVLSKGHAAPAYYAALAERGYFNVAELEKLRQIDSMLQGHPDMVKIRGVDMSTGSLGQGLSAANGMALVLKRKKKDSHVFCILGDGEMQEGQIWEAIMTSAHYKLDNLTVFVDKNSLQIDGVVSEIMNNTPYEAKFEAFGWNTITIDGNDITQIIDGINLAKKVKGKPTVIICETIKGKGVSYMENQVGWHGAAPNKEQAKVALSEIDAIIKALEVE